MARAEITAFVCLSSFTSAIGLIGAKTTSRTVSYPVNPFKLYQQWCYEKHYQHQNSNTQRSWAFLSRLPLIQKQKGATQPTFSQQPLTLHPPLLYQENKATRNPLSHIPQSIYLDISKFLSPDFSGSSSIKAWEGFIQGCDSNGFLAAANTFNHRPRLYQSIGAKCE